MFHHNKTPCLTLNSREMNLNKEGTSINFFGEKVDYMPLNFSQFYCGLLAMF